MDFTRSGDCFGLADHKKDLLGWVTGPPCRLRHSHPFGPRGTGQRKPVREKGDEKPQEAFDDAEWFVDGYYRVTWCWGIRSRRLFISSTGALLHE